MHIEVFEQERMTGGMKSWYWHFKNGSKITADAEAFPTKANAMRAAKAVVRATIKEFYGYSPTIKFYSTKTPTGSLRITWGGE